MNSAATSCMRLPSIQCFCIPRCGVSGRNNAAAITRCSSRSSAGQLILRGARSELSVPEFVGFEGFMMDFVKRWDSIVPFQQRGRVADQLEGMGVHVPYRVEHWMIVRVEKVLFELRVTGDMNLPNAMMRNVVEVNRRDRSYGSSTRRKCCLHPGEYRSRPTRPLHLGIPTPSFLRRGTRRSCSRFRRRWEPQENRVPRGSSVRYVAQRQTCTAWAADRAYSVHRHYPSKDDRRATGSLFVLPDA